MYSNLRIAAQAICLPALPLAFIRSPTRFIIVLAILGQAIGLQQSPSHPVLVDIAKDAQTNTAPFIWPEVINLPGYHPVTQPHVKQIREAARLIAESERPVLYVGGGVIKAEAADELARLVEITNIPVVTTLMARGALPDSHELNMGMPGMHGTVAAVGALQRADLLVALGTRFDDRVTGKLDTFAPNAKIIHADIDPAEISKNRQADVPIVGDVKAVITESFERIHRSNLIGMGVVPLQFPEGQSWKSLGLDGTEIVSIEGLEELNNGTTPKTVKVSAAPSEFSPEGKQPIVFDAKVRIDTPGEADYYRNGGILQYVLRSLV